MKVFTSFISVLQTEQQILCQHKIGVCDFNVAYFVIVISFDKRKQNAAGIKKCYFYIIGLPQHLFSFNVVLTSNMQYFKIRYTIRRRLTLYYFNSLVENKAQCDKIFSASSTIRPQ